ncbi:MAG: DNA-directed RNA polymerase subunit alpha C-terminal domain-containing protein [Planctomycetota bacterium]|jgi:DNA-directed RNA polymerase subunit alpha
MTGTLDAIAEQVRSGNLTEAESALGGVAATEENKAQHAFVRGLMKEMQYEMEDAYNAYSEAMEADPDHLEAMFRAARMANMLGDDEHAIELYENCAQKDTTDVNALINLAIIYEDNNRLDQAENCLRHVLAENPGHVRARQFLRSVECSYNMVYDERQAREREKHDAVLDTPITDFELSVRSRNCLKQMNIHTLGDLLRTTEAELLSYKNFGETSLNEIKAMLQQKGLRLGQSLQAPAPQRIATAPVLGSPPPPSADVGAAASILVSTLELSVRSRKCLQRLGIATLGDLASRTEAELSSTRNFGETSLNEIKRAMSAYGVSFRQS